jgi:hypothetical protein
MCIGAEIDYILTASLQDANAYTSDYFSSNASRFYLHPKLARTWDIYRRASSWLEPFLLRVIGSEVDFLTTFVPSRHPNDVLAQHLSRLSQAAGVGYSWCRIAGKYCREQTRCDVLNQILHQSRGLICWWPRCMLSMNFFPITKNYFYKIFLTFSFHLQVKFVLIF